MQKLKGLNKAVNTGDALVNLNNDFALIYIANCREMSLLWSMP